MEEYVRRLLNRAKQNDKVATGKLLTLLESSPRDAIDLLRLILGEGGGKAHVVGVTGVPGSGKSTLISKLLYSYRRDGYRVAVIAIDPTSPLSKGAILGDRIRMQEHTLDPNVFIRSVSTRGLKGGLSFAGVAMIEVFDYLGYDKIFIESVGVGQAETDIMNVAHTILVVTMPGVGDEIQALKAGVMEIGDIYVLNKSDKEEAAKTYEYINFALEVGEVGKREGWRPRLLKTSALMNYGVEDVRSAIDDHLNYIKDRLFVKVASRRKLLIKLLLEKLFVDALDKEFEELTYLDFSNLKDGPHLLRGVVKRVFDRLDFDLSQVY